MQPADKALILEELCAAVARRLGVTKEDTKRVVRATLEEIGNSLSSARPVHIHGFGNFLIRQRKRRTALNPHAAARGIIETVEVPPCCVCMFKPAKKIKFSLIQRTVA